VNRGEGGEEGRSKEGLGRGGGSGRDGVREEYGSW
jgi:hypothetical protein